MGGWKLEVAKMAVYMAFPVGLFHYFNQPEYFEEWVVGVKREMYPPERAEDREAFEKCVMEHREKEEKKVLDALNRKSQLSGAA